MRSSRLIAFILAFAGNSVVAADNLHWPGFVASSCNHADHCFELLVEPEYQALEKERNYLYFDADRRIFDPENHELTLAQQNIVPGSQMTATTADRASFICIGD